MAIPTITGYTGVIPDRRTQSAEDFTSAAVTWTDYQASTLVPSTNAAIDGINAAQDEILDSVNNAEESSFIAQAAANYQGPWFSGAQVVKGESWSHNRLMWAANVTGAGEPQENAQWFLISSAKSIGTTTDENIQDFIDSFALKIFQSPTDGGLTEIQTRTVNASEVYEVRKTSDDSLAAIYSDAAGTTEIVQNGTNNNKSGSDGVVEFYIADGDYYVEVDSIQSNFEVGVLRQDLANYTDPLKGAGQVGWKRTQISNAVTNVGGMLNVIPVSIWEFAQHVTDKPDPDDPDTWNWTPAFNASKKSGIHLQLTSGKFHIDSWAIDKNMIVSGFGRNETEIVFTGFSIYEGIKYSLLSKADDASGLSGVVQLLELTIQCLTTEPDVQGLMVTRKLFAKNIYVKQATGSGIYFRSVNMNLEAPYFSRFESVMSKLNGASGAMITENCNANLFDNCQFDQNAEHGFHQAIADNGQPRAVYNNTLIGGQASYNQKNGIFFENGSENFVFGTYAEYNSVVDGSDPRTGAFKNLQLGTDITRSHCVLGSQGSSTGLDSMVGLNNVTGNFVSVGGMVLTPSRSLDVGYRNVGSGRSLTFNGGTGCEHNVLFNEGLGTIFGLRYSGAADDPQNTFLLESYRDGVPSEIFRATNNQRIRFFGGGNTQARQTVSGSRGGNEALASLITALANLGLIEDSTTI